jgi:hypothetical protein
MAAIDFPNPATQTPVNTFSPTSTPSATANGVTYTWDGSKWVAQVAGGGSQWTTTGSDIYYDTGKVLVGTTSPVVSDTKVEIKGNNSGSGGGKLTIAATQNWQDSGDLIGAIYFANNSGGTPATIQAQGDGFGGSNDYPSRLVFSTTADGASSPTERMRIASNGQVLIGTTVTSNATPFVVESPVAGTAGGNYNLVTINSTGTADNGAACLHLGKKDNSSATSQIFQRFYINNASTGSGQINANGASSAAFGTFSDERLKENISNLPSQLQNICSLRPVEFDYKDGSGHQVGFIAQEMEAIYPDVVGETDGMLTVTGWSKTEARLVKALQEAVERIETLEAANADLAARITALEGGN